MTETAMTIDPDQEVGFYDWRAVLLKELRVHLVLKTGPKTVSATFHFDDQGLELDVNPIPGFPDSDDLRDFLDGILEDQCTQETLGDGYGTMVWDILTDKITIDYKERVISYINHILEV